MRSLFLAALLAVLSGCPKRAPEPELATTPPPAAPRVPAPIEIPQREGALVLVLPLEVRGAPLLGPEVERLRRWAARHLAIQTEVALSVLPLEEVDRVAELARTRRMGLDGAICEAPMPLHLALERSWPAAARAQPVAACDERGCRFQVQLTGAEGSGKAAWSAQVLGPATFESWEAAAQALSPGAPPPAPAIDEERSSAPFVEVVRAVPAGEWPAPPEVPGAVRSQLERCHQKGHPARAPDTVVVQLADAGQVSGCTAFGGSVGAPVHVLGCYCDALRTAAFPAGPAGRRLALSVLDRPDLFAYAADGTPIASTVVDFKASDPALEPAAFSGILPWTGLCYATTRLRDPVELPVELTVSPIGQILTAELGGPEVDKNLSACIEGYVRFVALPCTISGAAATAQFTLRIERRVDPKRGQGYFFAVSGHGQRERKK